VVFEHLLSPYDIQWAVDVPREGLRLYDPLPLTLLSARSLSIFITADKAYKPRNLVMLRSIIISSKKGEQKPRIQICFMICFMRSWHLDDKPPATAVEYLDEYL
jgi:hypothetical protein